MDHHTTMPQALITSTVSMWEGEGLGVCVCECVGGRGAGVLISYDFFFSQSFRDFLKNNAVVGYSAK